MISFSPRLSLGEELKVALTGKAEPFRTEGGKAAAGLY